MNRDSYLIFDAYREILNEALPGVNPELEKDVITKSFQKEVLSDVLAKASTQHLDWDDCKTCPTKTLCDKATEGDLVSSEKILEYLQKKIPQIKFSDYITVDPKANRVVIKFNEQGEGSLIHIPEKLNRYLGPVIILHEIAHKLYTIDILTKELAEHPLASEIFTLARTIEDARIEKLMEQDYPETASIFKERARFIVPLYKTHTPSKFAKIVDDLFLYLRGYDNNYKGNPDYLKLGEDFIRVGNDRDKKVAIIIALGELIDKTISKQA